ncbi:hypothetical protein BDN70DRAFT_879171 [Pholiota conissans]|uniref:F-box domain-containing protein n=1 Tax=Pholiota conissans TaxID=109636 RepID=A0A9P6CT92_9AGAR|nr:hypothetical protein BDN70DRAFT_879171 [Pholiota conissans]
MWPLQNISDLKPPPHPRSPHYCRTSFGWPCPPCRELTQLDKSRDQDEDWAKERDLLLIRINDRHDPLCHYLPVELAAKIFAIYCEEYRKTIEESGLVGRTASPLRLAAVCRRWRDIAFNTPVLWAFLLISHSRYWVAHPDIVEQWLRRTGTRPLSIRISLKESQNYTNGQKRSICTIFDHLRDYSDRWKFMNIFMLSKHCKMLLGDRHIETPLLEGIELRIEDERYDVISPVANLATPRLIKASLWRLWLPTVTLDWANLTSLQCTLSSIDEVIKLLSLSPRLIECDFLDICDDSFIYPLPNNVFEHHSIQRLKLHPDAFMEEDVMYTFFDSLILSALERFTYDFKGSVFPLDPEPLTSFLDCSVITYLSLENINFKCIPPSLILTILEIISPTLTELHIQCWDSRPHRCDKLPNMLFERLAASAVFDPDSDDTFEPEFLPDLRTLVYKGSKPSPNAWRELQPAIYNLALSLEAPIIAAKNTPGKYFKFSRPLDDVQFTLTNMFVQSDKNKSPGTTFSRDVFLLLRKLQDECIDLNISEEMMDASGTVTDEIDLIEHFELTRSFTMFDRFPVHWFSDN